MTLEDVLKYAVKVENESNLFYGAAVKVVTNGAVGELLLALQEEEVKHEDRLSKILEMTLDKSMFAFAGEQLDRMVDNSDIPADASVKAVLEIALEREKATRDFYSRVSTLTNIDASVVEVFEMLFDQESGHVTRISKMLESL